MKFRASRFEAESFTNEAQNLNGSKNSPSYPLQSGEKVSATRHEFRRHMACVASSSSSSALRRASNAACCARPAAVHTRQMLGISALPSWRGLSLGAGAKS
jgi:hypothetical protein